MKSNSLVRVNNRIVRTNTRLLYYIVSLFKLNIRSTEFLKFKVIDKETFMNRTLITSISFFMKHVVPNK